MAELGEASVKIGFDVETDKLHKLESAIEGIHHQLEVLSTIEVVRGLFELVEKFSAFGEQTMVAARSAGITVEAFQELTYAATQSAVSQDELEGSMRRLARSLYSAREGSEESMKAFRDVGISPEQVKSFRNSEDALLALSDRFSKISDPIQKAALSQSLMGRGSVHMVGFLSQGSAAIRGQTEAAEKLGLVLSEGQVEALEKVEGALKRVFLLFKIVSASIASNVAPIFTYLIDDFIQFFGVNRDIIELNFNNWLHGVAYTMGVFYGILKVVSVSFLELLKMFHLEGYVIPFIAGIASIVGTILVAKKTFEAFQSAIATTMESFQMLKTAFTLGMAAFSSPWFLALAAIGAVILAIHDLWALFEGKPTWIGAFKDWLLALEPVKETLDAIYWAWSKVKEGLSGVGKLLSSAVKSLGIPSLLPQVTQNVSQIGSQSASLPPSLNSYTNTPSNFDIDAPITINVPPGTDPSQVGSAVQTSLNDHFSRVLRETRRSTSTAVAY